MTAFLDAYALVALLVDEPAAAEVEQILREEAECRVIVINLAEAIDVACRVHELEADDVRDVIEPLSLAGAISTVASDTRAAWAAAELRAKHYEKKSMALSLADCFLLAHALSSGGSIATSDPPLARAARAEGVSVVALPDTAGRRP